jgi:hypothetical protein
MRMLLAAILSAGLASGCNLHDGLMGDHAAALDRHMAAFADETSMHGTRVHAAADMAAMGAMEDEHLASGRGHLDMMRTEVDGMMSCSMNMASMSAAMTDMSSLRAECEAHREAMHNMMDTAAAHAEESRHQEAMGRVMSDMQAHIGGAEEDMACSHP